MTADFPLFIPTWRAGAIWGQRLRLEPTCQPHTRFNNICRPPRKIFFKHLLREMHLCWLNFLTWYQINFSFFRTVLENIVLDSQGFSSLKGRRLLFPEPWSDEMLTNRYNWRQFFLQVQVLHWCEHWPICQSRRTASVTNTLSNLRQIRKKCYVGHWPICQSRQHLAAWALLLSSPSPMFTRYRDCPSHIWLL